VTAQFLDGFRYKEKDYAIAGIHGEALFDPENLGLNPAVTCTACSRGYVCTYTLLGKQLVVSRLAVNLLDFHAEPEWLPVPGPEINGRKPMLAEERFPLFNNLYEDLELPVRFTGGLLIARDFIQELYVHMGFHPAWKFHEVWELLFDDGILTESQDVSLKVAELRKKLEPTLLKPKEPKGKLKWVKDTFKLDY